MVSLEEISNWKYQKFRNGVSLIVPTVLCVYQHKIKLNLEHVVLTQNIQYIPIPASSFQFIFVLSSVNHNTI